MHGVPACKSVGVLSDFDLMRLLFASLGTANFDCLQGDIGYKWAARTVFCNDTDARPLVEAGVLPKDEEDDWPTITWLEHQVRLITSNLRPIDMYYEPYDQLADKACWGKEVLLLRRQKSDDEDGENLHEVPWLLWDRKEAEKKAFRGGGDEMMSLMLSRIIGQQFNR